MLKESPTSLSDGSRRTQNGRTARVLVAMENSETRDAVHAALAEVGFAVTEALPKECEETARVPVPPDLIIVDIDARDGGCCEVLRSLNRESGPPTVVVTSRTDETDRIIALELGADDYIVTPFSPRELVARVRAVLRRAYPGQNHDEGAPAIRIHDLVIDEPAYEARLRGRVLDLTRAQFRILAALARHAGQALTRAQLAQVLQYDGSMDERTIDRHINNLRRIIERDLERPRYVQTVFGVGYKMPRNGDSM